MVSIRKFKKSVKFVVSVSFMYEDLVKGVRGQRRYISWPEAGAIAGELLMGNILNKSKVTKEKLLRIDKTNCGSYKLKKGLKIRNSST